MCETATKQSAALSWADLSEHADYEPEERRCNSSVPEVEVQQLQQFDGLVPGPFRDQFRRYAEVKAPALQAKPQSQLKQATEDDGFRPARSNRRKKRMR